jgi:hypothetical protein
MAYCIPVFMVINEVEYKVALTERASTLKEQFEGWPDLFMLCIIESIASPRLFCFTAVRSSVLTAVTVTASEHFMNYLLRIGAGVAQSVWCLTADWTTGV